MAFRPRIVLPAVLLLLATGAALQLSSQPSNAAFTCGSVPDVISHGPRLGEVTEVSVKVWARACVQTAVSVEYKEASQDWSAAEQTAGVLTDPAKDNTVVISATGLTAGTNYDYRLLAEGQLPTKPFNGTFHTLPATGPMTFIIASDMHNPFQGYGGDTTNVPDTILNLMASKNADFSFMMGDQIVIEVVLNNLGRCCDPKSQADYELAYRDMSANGPFRNFAANTPLMTDWDDHEIINDFSASTPDQYVYPWAKNAFDEYFGSLNSSPLADGVQYIYRAGDIEFFVLDTRTYRSADMEPDSPAKTMLGADQKQALKDWLLNSDATFKMIISSVMFSDFSQHVIYGESWPAFATERNEILDFIKDNRVSGVMLFSGDEHSGRVFKMDPWGIYEIAPNPLGDKLGSSIPPDPQIKFQSNFTRLFGLLTADTSVCPATLDVKLIDKNNVVRYELPLTEADLDSDRDSDGLLTCEENQLGTDPADPDTDGDHCGDATEIGTSHLAGGQRDPLDPWDYFNPSGDGQNRIDDVLRAVQQYFVDSGNPNYTQITDRTFAGPEAWRTGAPDGKQRVDDILAALHVYFNDCTLVP